MNDSTLIQKMKQEYDKKMKDLVAKYKEEMESNAKLKEDMNKLKSSYEDKLTSHNLRPSGNELQSPTASPDHKPDDLQNSDITQMQAIERLHALEEQMVGGEKANDTELKEKRAKRKKVAEKKINAISDALSKLDDDDKILLKAYGDITEELRARTILLKKAKKKIQALEQEVNDLQSEFESDRTGL